MDKVARIKMMVSGGIPAYRKACYIRWLYDAKYALSKFKKRVLSH